MTRLVETSKLVRNGEVAGGGGGGGTLLEFATYADLPTVRNGLPGVPADRTRAELTDQDWPIFWIYYVTVPGSPGVADRWLPGVTGQGIEYVADTGSRPWRASRRNAGEYLQDICTTHLAYDGEAGGPFQVAETLTFGAGGTATVTALIDNGSFGSIAYTRLTGPDPLDNESITGGTSGATALQRGAVIVTAADRGFMRTIFGTTSPDPILHDGTLDYDSASGAFTVGELVTFGGGGTARVVRDVDTSPPPGEGTLSLLIVTLPLPLDDETITGATSGSTADVDGSFPFDSFVFDTVSNAAGSRLAALQFGAVAPTDFGPLGPGGGGFRFLMVIEPKVVVTPPFVDFASAVFMDDQARSVRWSNSFGGATTAAGSGRARYVPQTGGPTGQQRINRLADFDVLFVFGIFRPIGAPSPPGGQEDGQVLYGWKAIEGMIFGSNSGYEYFRCAASTLNRLLLGYTSTSSSGLTSRSEIAEFHCYKFIPTP